MKMTKKLATLLLAVCLVVPGFSMLVHAASGQIMFTDPETVVGQTVEVKGVLKADSNIEDRKISMAYDTTMLKFIEGQNVTESSSGNITYEVTGKKDTDRVEFLMKFSVLKEGTTKIEVVSYDAWTTSNQQIDCVKGSSTIKIEAGEGNVSQGPVETTDVTVSVNGVEYTLASTFEESVIPEGFQKTEFDYQGTSCTAVVNENASVFLGYLIDANGAGEFFLYLMDTATFVPYESLKISDSVMIALLSDTSEVSLPEQYVITEVIVNGSSYPAWQTAEDTSRCILYALNSKGEKALYQYDVEEGTYQRFVAPELTEEPVEESNFGKLTELLESHMDYVVLGTGLGFILLVLIIIILGVKLYNRNAELDEIYEEYGLDEEDEELEENSGEDSHDNDSDERIVIFDDIEDFFVNIDDETEDDVVFEENEEEIEVEFFEQSNKKTEDISVEKIVIEEFKGEEPEYFDDDDDDFEIDFIDLDD